MKKKIKYISKCCNAYVIGVMSPDFIGDIPEQMQIGTCYYKCSLFDKPCDITTIEKMYGKKTKRRNK